MEFRKYGDIYYIHTYYPKRFSQHYEDGISEKILRFKDGLQVETDLFLGHFIECFDKIVNTNDKSRICIVTMPSHSKGDYSYALLYMAFKLEEKYGMENYSTLLYRHTTHPKLAHGGDRSIESHLNTIELREDVDLSGKRVVVLDNVTTTGNSLIAAKQILSDTNAKKIVGIAIAKTFSLY